MTARNDVRPSLCSLSAIVRPSSSTTSYTSLSFPTPICLPTPAMEPRAVSARMARKSYPSDVSLYPSYFLPSWCTNLCLNSVFKHLNVPPCFSLAIDSTNCAGTISWFF